MDRFSGEVNGLARVISSVGVRNRLYRQYGVSFADPADAYLDVVVRLGAVQRPGNVQRQVTFGDEARGLYRFSS